ncbi:hypothetical protein CYMTET_42438 [Cymbomonas tetramitiformis]|uniref:Cation efflux protein cytoplasmic domain-containing protein n=1 Tax=Cymbomonas tetramitiformis TaxID=36881 RepID=A0AAE0C568_9CHLO|nr:hypothetical protein CYMTET_42438 [Cymbomonas tetramitiformis]
MFRGSVTSVEGVLACRALRGRRMGPYIAVDVVVEVDPWLSVSVGHRIACQVSASVKREHEEVLEVFAHIVPAGTGLEEPGETAGRSTFEIETEIHDIVASRYPEVLKISHLTMHLMAGKQGLVVIVDLMMEQELLPRAPDIAAQLQNEIQSIKGVCEADIHLDLTTIPSEDRKWY